jgi:hypothetical protein
VYIPYSHFCLYPGPTTSKHTSFPNLGRDINKSVNRGYIQASKKFDIIDKLSKNFWPENVTLAVIIDEKSYVLITSISTPAETNRINTSMKRLIDTKLSLVEISNNAVLNSISVEL